MDKLTRKGQREKKSDLRLTETCNI